MSEPNFEALGRYTAHMDTFAAITAARAVSLDALKRWAAPTSVGKRSVMLLDLERLEALLRELRQQQTDLDPLARVINLLARELDRPSVHFVAHQVL